ncbi:MAG: ABC transporter ATP-binding protein [Planctomycetes bacterium]|nr:ABC transporter ATP-binding protein [Planctomycetota bacterium]
MRIELVHAGKRFGRVIALQDVSLELPSGSRTALIGPNGSGKSTLVRLLMGMLEGRGTALIDGLDTADDRAPLARRMAYMPQIAPRFAAPVRDVVHAIASVREIEIAAIERIAQELRLDLNGLWKRPFRALSGGQRQKVLAALTLASGAELFLLDEPTASMDPASRDAFFALVESLARSATILLSSHRLEEIRRLVDRVVALEDGAIVWQGAAEDYLAEKATAVIEVRVALESAAWLESRGFAPRSGGWWVKAVPAGERASELRTVVKHLNGELIDVTAKDIERLSVEERRR